MDQIGDIIKKSPIKNFTNVNNVDKNISNNDDTFNVNVDSSDNEEKNRCTAKDLAKQLNDFKNLNYFLKISKEHEPEFLYECLSITLTAKREGKVRKTPAKYFVGVFKKRSITK